MRKAVIPAAGLGTRFLPATKAQPKEMLPLVDKPTIQYIVEEAVASGIENILIITGRNKRAIEDHFDRSVELEVALNHSRPDLLRLVQDVSELVDIHYVRQKEPRGLGHAVWCARAFIGSEPFAVLLGDDVVRSELPALRQLMEVYERTGGCVLGVQEVPPDQVSRYGIVDPQPTGEPRLFRVVDFVEKPPRDRAPSRLAVLGRYILEPEIFPILERTGPGAGGEIQLTDAIRELARQRPVYAYVFEGRRYDVGDKLGFLQATVELALERPDLGPAFREYLLDLVSRLEGAAAPGKAAAGSGAQER